MWSFELGNIPVFLVITGYHRIESIYIGSPPPKKKSKSPKTRVSHNWDCPQTAIPIRNRCENAVLLIKLRVTLQGGAPQLKVAL